VDTNAIARIQSDRSVTGVKAIAGGNEAVHDADTVLSSTSTVATTLQFGNTSALNGVTFAFTMDEQQEGFNKSTGVLTVFLNTNLHTDDDLYTVIDSSVAANWEAIRTFTGSTLLAPGENEKVDAVASSITLVKAQA